MVARQASRPISTSPAITKSMKANRGKNTAPEMALRKLLRDAGFPGYRLHWKVQGSPDIAYPSRKLAIFVNGCFWHRCPHCLPSHPASNQEFWEEKFEANIARDTRNVEALTAAGWKVLVVWECELRENPQREVERVVGAIAKRTP